MLFDRSHLVYYKKILKSEKWYKLQNEDNVLSGLNGENGQSLWDRGSIEYISSPSVQNKMLTLFNINDIFLFLFLEVNTSVRLL